VKEVPAVKLLIAVVQQDDAKRATRALVEAGLGVTSLPSAGGLLGHKSATLFCGLEDQQVEWAIEILSRFCERRTVELSHGHPFFSLYNKVEVGGAVIFVADLDRTVRL
jgi:uncharacterized protein YaaQ